MITLENDRLKIEISNDRAMKIMSFKDKANNKEWVWKPEHSESLPQGELDLEASFDSSWEGGWEEVFPNDAPCSLHNYNLVDHGEVWRKPWNILEQQENLVRGDFHCVTMPMTLEKTISLDPSQARLNLIYKIRNTSSHHLPYLFKFHPALNIEEGDRFIFPESKMKPVALPFSRLLGTSDSMNFPTGKSPTGGVARIDEVMPNDGYSREFVKISDFKSGECSLFNKRTNTELRFDFDINDFPYVWLFLSYGSFMDHYVAMMEPTNAHHYDLCHAQENDRAFKIKPGEEKTFTLGISLRDL